MKSTLQIFSVLSIIIAVSGCKTYRAATATKAYTNEGYKLVWSDEFNNDGAPDSARWKYENGFVRNEESQWYQEEYAFF